MSVVRCENCSGWVETSRTTSIRLRKHEEDGTPAVNKAGEPVYAYVRLPFHVFPPSTLDPTGLVPAACNHGLAFHPDPEREAWGKGRGHSWIRSRYVALDGRCPVCRGEPAPADLMGKVA